jgi:hypothetical protein
VARAQLATTSRCQHAVLTLPSVLNGSLEQRHLDAVHHLEVLIGRLEQMLLHASSSRALMLPLP